MAEENEIDQMANQLERLMGDPIADSVQGFVRVVTVSDPKGRFGYLTCHVRVATEAEGIPETLVDTEIATKRKWWPTVGQRLPARIAKARPSRIDVDWDALSRTAPAATADPAPTVPEPTDPEPTDPERTDPERTDR